MAIPLHTLAITSLPKSVDVKGIYSFSGFLCLNFKIRVFVIVDLTMFFQFANLYK